jgi:hypothetical protein
MNKELMDKDPLKMRPHHVEGAIAYLNPSLRTDKGPEKDFYDLLASTLEKDSEAEVVFVTTTEDPICKECLKIKGVCMALLEEDVTEELILKIDVDNAREHGWEFDKRYKIRDILAYIKAQAPKRNIIYNVAALPNMTDVVNGKVRNLHDVWVRDIRAAKSN